MSLNLWLKWIPVIITETQITYIRANKYITSMSLLKQQATMLVHSLFSHLSVLIGWRSRTKVTYTSTSKGDPRKGRKEQARFDENFWTKFFFYLIKSWFHLFSTSFAFLLQKWMKVVWWAYSNPYRQVDRAQMQSNEWRLPVVPSFSRKSFGSLLVSCGQSYKCSVIIIYDSRVVQNVAKFLVSITLLSN